MSNENDDAVYFDNFTVSDTRGRIIEEDHYYAFGLKIAGISSVKFGDEHEGSLKNNNLYNDKELWDDADLNWYDYGFRNYDPQIGRFPQLDPLTWDYPELTNYQYASNEPIANVDMDGLEKFNVIQTLSEVVITMPKTSGSFNLVNQVAKIGGSFLSGAIHMVSDFASEMASRAKVNIAKDIAWVKNTANTLSNNAKMNWGSGNTIVQQFGRDAMANPLTLLNGSAEANIVKGALGIEVRTTVGVEKSLLKYEVRNVRLANKVHPKTGVPFDESGFPDFTKNLYKGGANDVMIRPTKNRILDEAAANTAAGYKQTPKDYTWHHHQQTGRMQLVETKIHRKTGHTGGFAIW